MAVPAASSIVSYGGAATSNFLSTPTTPFLQGFYNSNFFTNRINSCAPYRVDRIRRNLQDEEENGYPSSDDRRRGALFCRSGTWLEMLPFEDEEDGTTRVKVHGTKNENSKFSVVEFISVAMSLVSIRGVETKNFICMDPSGKLYATPTSNYSTECVFFEEMMENYYNLYASCAYGSSNNPWYIELRRSGKPRRGPNSKKRRKASHFLVVHHDLDRLRHPLKPDGNDLNDLVVASLFHQPPSHPLFRPQTPTKPPHSPRISKLRAKMEVTMDAAEKERLIAEKKKRRERKNRRREDRLRKEEQRREARRQELRELREEEIRQRAEVQRRYQEHIATNRFRLTTTTTPFPPRAQYPTYRTPRPPPPPPTHAAYNPYWHVLTTVAPRPSSSVHPYYHRPHPNDPRVQQYPRDPRDPRQPHRTPPNVNYQRYP